MPFVGVHQFIFHHQALHWYITLRTFFQMQKEWVRGVQNIWTVDHPYLQKRVPCQANGNFVFFPSHASLLVLHNTLVEYITIQCSALIFTHCSHHCEHCLIFKTHRRCPILFSIFSLNQEEMGHHPKDWFHLENSHSSLAQPSQRPPEIQSLTGMWMHHTVDKILVNESLLDTPGSRCSLQTMTNLLLRNNLL